MKAGICPKCGADAIYVSEPQRDQLQRGKHILAQQARWIARYVDLTHYGCARCGYVEAYAADERSIEHMMRFWEPLTHKRKHDTPNEDQDE